MLSALQHDEIEKAFSCPHCGSRTDLDSNSARAFCDLTLLCLAPVPAGEEDSFGEVSDGSGQCGLQWDPEGCIDFTGWGEDDDGAEMYDAARKYAARYLDNSQRRRFA